MEVTIDARIRRIVMQAFLVAISAGPATIVSRARHGRGSDRARGAERGGGKTPDCRTEQAIRKKNWDAALADIKQAQTAAHKTDKDEYNIDDLLGYVLYRQNKYEQAALVYERLLESPLIPAQQASELGKSIAEMYFRLGSYPKAAKWADKYLALGIRIRADIRSILGDSYFRMGDSAEAAATMAVAIADAERAGKYPRRAGFASKMTLTFVSTTFKA